MLTVTPAESSADLDLVRALFREYAATLEPVDLAYQDFPAELAALPGKYAAPRGALLLAHWSGDAAGCGALRALDDAGTCEMKRLYVRPGFRGRDVGGALARALIERSRAAGYRHMRLDTLSTMGRAVALYRGLGFEPIAPYYDTPIEGTIFMELVLG